MLTPIPLRGGQRRRPTASTAPRSPKPARPHRTAQLLLSGRWLPAPRLRRRQRRRCGGTSTGAPSAIPPGCCDPHRIAHNLIAALATAGCKGPVSVFAYGDASRIAPDVLEALSSTGICLNHVSAGAKDGVDKKMLVDMVFWAYDNPPPGNYLLISGDQDFSDLLHKLKMKKYEILLAQPPDVSFRGLVTAAKIVWVWASLAAGEPLLEKPPHSHSVTDCNRNSNNLDASKKVRATDNKSDSNVKAGVKQLQKYVKKSYITSSFASNQTQVDQVDGVSQDSTGSTASELDRSSVSSSSSSELIEATKVDQSSLLGIPTLSQSSAQKPEVSAHLHQMEISQGLVLGEEPSISTECASRNGTLVGVSSNGHYHQIYQQSKSSKAYTGEKIEKGCNESKVKPLQKYVRKITTACSSSKQVDSIRTYDCSVSSTRSEVHLSSVLSSSSSKSVEGTKVGYAGPPGTSTLFQSSAKNPTASVHLHQVRAPQKSILGKKPSTSIRHTSRNGNNHGLGVSLGNCHPTYQQQSKSSQAQSKLHLHFNCKVGDNNGKSGNQYKVKQHQEYVRKKVTSSSFASNEISLGFSGNFKGSILGQPSQPLSSLSCSESLDGTKINPLSSLSSAQKPATPTHLHREGAGFIFGNKPSTSIECMQKNETLCFGVSGGYYDPTYQQTQSSMLLKQDKSSPPNRHSGFDQSYSTNCVIGSSALPSAGHNGVASSQLQTCSGGSIFQGLADICFDMSRLTISEGLTRLPSQGVPANYSSFTMSNVSGDSIVLHETGSSFHPDPDTSFHPNHSSASQNAQPPSSV